MPRTGQHAIVLGASLAGLFTARVLTESFAEVTLVDRDVLPRRAGPAQRSAFLRVADTVDLPEQLLRPSVALRVLRAGRHRATGSPPTAAPTAAGDVPPVGIEPTLGPF